MGDSCCAPEASDVVKLTPTDRMVLVVALALNLGCFCIEFVGGILVHSLSLGADSIDMLGDGMIYALTLTALHKDTTAGKTILRLKTAIMGVSGLAFLTQGLFRFYSHPHILPDKDAMTQIGLIALVANLICTILFLRFRNADLNLKSAWICSRNDSISNFGIILAAWLVGRTGSAWPDLVTGVLLAGLVLYSSFSLLRESEHQH